MVERVTATADALAMIEKLMGIHGPLLFHQSGGCCDGSAPMCYPRGDFRVGAQDVYLGEIGGQPFYMGAAQFDYWQHTHLIIDMVPGRGSGFSLEAPEGVRFLTRSRVYSDAEYKELEKIGPPPTGAERPATAAA
ncbi:DUF779 domain-containing protein [Hyphomicrobium sp.]|uniref:DUF779 domain-containing protein n=1 Tax=Hyphomicrobium sp. TaxID=82 RepID=UPI002E3573BF|nr:DUF779 domain-containing protein [Hyphomicrobium sp.]HEX2843366.1 DUF779 domain-containing protein [Hyphomicrobium sp.]